MVFFVVVVHIYTSDKIQKLSQYILNMVSDDIFSGQEADTFGLVWSRELISGTWAWPEPTDGNRTYCLKQISIFSKQCAPWVILDLDVFLISNFGLVTKILHNIS